MGMWIIAGLITLICIGALFILAWAQQFGEQHDLIQTERD